MTILQDVENTEEAVKTIQRLLRGRGVQNKMYEGRDLQQELVRELRSTMNDGLEPPIVLKQRRHDLLQHKVRLGSVTMNW